MNGEGGVLYELKRRRIELLPNCRINCSNRIKSICWPRHPALSLLPRIVIRENHLPPASSVTLKCGPRSNCPIIIRSWKTRLGCSDCHNPHAATRLKAAERVYRKSIKGGRNRLAGPQRDLLCNVTLPNAVHLCSNMKPSAKGCVSCHSPHGSVNQRMLTERNATLCLKCHFQQQTQDGRIFIGDGDHTRLQQGTCWSAGCHEAVHGSQVNVHFRY